MAENTMMDISTDPAMQEALTKLSELEKDFAAVELDARTFSPCSLHTERLEAPNLKLRLRFGKC